MSRCGRGLGGAWLGRGGRGRERGVVWERDACASGYAALGLGGNCGRHLVVYGGRV